MNDSVPMNGTAKVFLKIENGENLPLFRFFSIKIKSDSMEASNVIDAGIRYNLCLVVAASALGSGAGIGN